MTTLYIPLALAALGIVLRGSGFAFRHALTGPVREPATRVFGISSVLTPFFFGTVVGAIASGEVPADGDGDPTASWTGVLPLLTGVLFVAICAYVAAVFLVRDAGAAGDRELQRYFARRALAIAVVAGAAAVAGIFALHADARFVYDGLTSEGLPLVILSGIAGLAALGLLVRGLSSGFDGRVEPPASPRRGRRRGHRDLGLLRRPAPLHAPDLADDRGRRRRLRRPHRGDRRLRDRRGGHPAVDRPALRALPAPGARVGIPGPDQELTAARVSPDGRRPSSR